MIQEFVDRFISNEKNTRSKLKAGPHPKDYAELVGWVIESISTKEYGGIDPKRIHEINDGDYQGTLLYLIAASNYQPSAYWYVRVSYGSCSGCDTLEDIKSSAGYEYRAPSDEQVDQYYTLMLHVVQGLKKLPGE